MDADVEIAPLDPVENEFGLNAPQIIRESLDLAAAVDMHEIVGQERPKYVHFTGDKRPATQLLEAPDLLFIGCHVLPLLLL